MKPYIHSMSVVARFPSNCFKDN